MKKKGFRIIKLLIILVVIVQLSVSAQTPKYFIISGKILSDSETFQNITVQITKNNQPAIVSQIPTTRRFRLELAYNSEYQLTFNQNGCLTKTIIVNTEIPAEVMQRESKFPHFLMAVKLEKAICEEENITTSNLIQHICYSPEKDIFSKLPTIFDIEYVEQNSLSIRQNSKLSENKSKLQSYQIF